MVYYIILYALITRICVFINTLSSLSRPTTRPIRRFHAVLVTMVRERKAGLRDPQTSVPLIRYRAGDMLRWQAVRGQTKTCTVGCTRVWEGKGGDTSASTFPSRNYWTAGCQATGISLNAQRSQVLRISTKQNAQASSQRCGRAILRSIRTPSGAL